MKMKAQTHRTIYVAIACAAALVLVWTLFLKGAPAGSRAVIALAQARPEIDFPAQAPTGALIAAQLQRAPGGLGQLRRAVGRDFVRRVQAVQVRTMPVRRFAFFIFLIPLQKLPFGTNGIGLHAREQGFHLGA